ncbi:MAG: CvpA family protein [Clostridia bacterium]|nr:CvpA family protein [Clostridia bacterium]
MLDIAVLVVIVFFAVRGIKKGFIKSLIDFLGAFIAMAAAGILSLPAAQWVYNTFFRDALTEKVAATVTGLDAADSVQAIFAEFPELILRALEAAGITESGVLAQIDAGTMNIAEAITAAISPMLIGLVRVLAMVVLFLLLLVVIRAVGTVVSGLFTLPLLNGVNKLLGFVFGIFLAVVAIWVVLACVQAFVPLVSTELQTKIITAQESSFVYRFLYDFNPAYSLIG